MTHVPTPNQAATPIYRRLVDKYKDDILSFRLRPGDQVDSIAEIQRRHGVARETAKRVLGILAEEGYIVQQPGRGSFVVDLGPKQAIWGLVFPFYSIQYDDLIHEISEKASASDRELRHFCDYNSYEEEIRLVGVMLKERYEAVVVIPTLDESKTWSFYSRLSSTDSSVVLLDHTMTSNDFDFVVQSYDLGVVRAIDYLLAQKDGGIAFIENEIWSGRNMVLELMRETYRDFMRSHRPGFDPIILPRATSIRADELRAHGVTGIFCCDDVSAIQVIGRLNERGANVPEHFNVVSYGNTDLGRFFTPAITTVDPHNAEMASVLAELVHPATKGAAASNRQYVVHPKLIVRGT
ncbi:MAG: GntR family transcriptional regulator [Candidatus Hydrogenedentes bacterium]|nr:GntR family transcriptional regulator [Candidatus Hydrogenedentota bacterium]